MLKEMEWMKARTVEALQAVLLVKGKEMEALLEEMMKWKWVRLSI